MRWSAGFSDCLTEVTFCIWGQCPGSGWDSVTFHKELGWTRLAKPVSCDPICGFKTNKRKDFIFVLFLAYWKKENEFSLFLFHWNKLYFILVRYKRIFTLISYLLIFSVCFAAITLGFCLVLSMYLCWITTILCFC